MSHQPLLFPFHLTPQDVLGVGQPPPQPQGTMDPGAGPESSLTINEQVSSGAGRAGREGDGQGMWARRKTPWSSSRSVRKRDLSGTEFGDLSCDFKK